MPRAETANRKRNPQIKSGILTRLYLGLVMLPDGNLNPNGFGEFKARWNELLNKEAPDEQPGTYTVGDDEAKAKMNSIIAQLQSHSRRVAGQVVKLVTDEKGNPIKDGENLVYIHKGADGKKEKKSIPLAEAETVEYPVFADTPETKRRAGGIDSLDFDELEVDLNALTGSAA